MGPYLDGELPPRAQAEVAAHLRECWRCSGDAVTVKLIKSALRQRARRSPPTLTTVRLRRYAQRLADSPP